MDADQKARSRMRKKSNGPKKSNEEIKWVKPLCLG